MSPFHLAQLRHLYRQMLDGHVKDTAAAARGLLGPAIVDEERRSCPFDVLEALAEEAQKADLGY